MSVIVIYGRHYGRYEETFPSETEAFAWIETQEDSGEIYAAKILDADTRAELYDGTDPFAKPRWTKST